MPKRVRSPKRGPKRNPRSKAKILRAWKQCTNKHVDVKNLPYALSMDLLDTKKTREMSKVCKKARFCCEAHLQKAKLVAARIMSEVFVAFFS